MQNVRTHSKHHSETEDFIQYQPALRAYALALTKASGDEDDLVQETIKKALQIKAEGKELRNPRAYLMSMLHNTFIDMKRRRIEGDPNALETLSVPGAQELQQTCRQVLEAIKRLPENHRVLLVLAGIQGMSYGDMAAKLKVNEGTITSRLSRARAALRADLGWDEKDNGHDAVWYSQSTPVLTPA